MYCFCTCFQRNWFLVNKLWTKKFFLISFCHFIFTFFKYMSPNLANITFLCTMQINALYVCIYVVFSMTNHNRKYIISIEIVVSISIYISLYWNDLIWRIATCWLSAQSVYIRSGDTSFFHVPKSVLPCQVPLYFFVIDLELTIHFSM